MTIKDLLESEFLQSERLRVELTRPVVDILDENLSVLPLRLKGQLTKHSQDEAIEFDYNIVEDEPETLASEMVRNFIDYLEYHDIRHVTNSLHHRILYFVFFLATRKF